MRWILFFICMSAKQPILLVYMCLWVIRWRMVLLLSVRESSLLCPCKVWVRITEASLLNAEQTLWILAETSLHFFLSWGLRQVWGPVFSPFHSTASCSLKLACYNLLRQWGAVAHHCRINGCRWKLGFSAFCLQ